MIVTEKVNKYHERSSSLNVYIERIVHPWSPTIKLQRRRWNFFGDKKEFKEKPKQSWTDWIKLMIWENILKRSVILIHS